MSGCWPNYAQVLIHDVSSLYAVFFAFYVAYGRLRSHSHHHCAFPKGHIAGGSQRCGDDRSIQDETADGLHQEVSRLLPPV